MTERINKLYKPAELVAAQRALQKVLHNDMGFTDASRILIALHKLGFRIVYVGNDK